MTAAILVSIIAGYWAGRLAERRRVRRASEREWLATVIEFPQRDDRIPFVSGRR